MPEHRGAMLRAYDKPTGREVGTVFMPAPPSGSLMTHILNGKQYIAVAISGRPYRVSTLRAPGRDLGRRSTSTTERLF
jgi:quinoprotein glucose dehydrogenase